MFQKPTSGVPFAFVHPMAGRHRLNHRGSISGGRLPRHMPRCRSISLFLTLLASAFCFPAAAADSNPWLEIHSTHFTVVTDAGEKKGREVAVRFEQMRAVFATLLGKEHLNQSIPLTILALNNDKSF